MFISGYIFLTKQAHFFRNLAWNTFHQSTLIAFESMDLTFRLEILKSQYLWLILMVDKYL